MQGGVEADFFVVVGHADGGIERPVVEASIGEVSNLITACWRIDRKECVELPESGFPCEHGRNKRHVADARSTIPAAHRSERGANIRLRSDPNVGQIGAHSIVRTQHRLPERIETTKESGVAFRIQPGSDNPGKRDTLGYRGIPLIMQIVGRSRYRGGKNSNRLNSNCTQCRVR